MLKIKIFLCSERDEEAELNLGKKSPEHISVK